MPSIYQPRRPRASPLWQLVHHGWDKFLANYESKHRKDLGPLHPAATATVESFLRCGDLASSAPIAATNASSPSPTRAATFVHPATNAASAPPATGSPPASATKSPTANLSAPFPKSYAASSANAASSSPISSTPRPFFASVTEASNGRPAESQRMRRMPFVALAKKGRTCLDLPDGRIGAIGAVRTFGDYLIFHPHLHVLAANGLFTLDGHFHCMPAEDLDPAIELFRHRFLHALREAKLISPGKLADLLSWKQSGFHIHDGGEKPVAAHDCAGRKRLPEYLLHHPFSLQKITG